MDFKSTIPERLALWTPEELRSLPLQGSGCGKCLKPGAVECCKFQPIFYNFHLGELGVAVSTALVKQSWLLPLGARPKQAQKPYPRFCDLFNESEARCSIWSKRPPECVTYFCEGDESLRVDFQKLNQRWHQYEAAVAQMALVELGFTRTDLRRQIQLLNFDENAVLNLSGDKLRDIWGEYSGKEGEFYRRCQEFSEGLDWREIERWISEG